MENTTIDFAQALIEDLQDENLFDSTEVSTEVKVIENKDSEKPELPKTEPIKNSQSSVISCELKPNFQLNQKDNEISESVASIVNEQPISQLSENTELNQEIDNSLSSVEIDNSQIQNDLASLPEPTEIAMLTSEKKSESNDDSNNNNETQIELPNYPKFLTEEPVEIVATDDYKKAISEISSLKTIEQLLYGVEQEQLKISTIPYDTVALNMALLGFQKGSTEDEERVYTEIEKWQSYLLDRDTQISLKDLRLYCETTTPKLSPRAILTLADFYQGVSKSKFEMLVTRSFSQDDEESERRHLFCDNQEISHHLKEICNESTDSNVHLKITTLKQFSDDIEEFGSIDGMIATDFLGRYQSFKQEIGDLFFDTRILGLIVQNNVLIGNHFVTLIEKERAKGSVGNIFNKETFGSIFEESVSEVVCKSISLDAIKAPLRKQTTEKTSKQLQIEKHKAELRAKSNKSQTKSSFQTEEKTYGGRIVRIIALCLILTSIIVGGSYFFLGDVLLGNDKLSDADIIQNESNRNGK